MGCNSTKQNGAQLIQYENTQRISKQSTELIEIQQNIIKHLNQQQYQIRTSVTSLKSALQSQSLYNQKMRDQKTEMTLSTIVLQTEVGTESLKKKSVY
ncbi:unnamed protein product [Paramecium sonneborni]|uniref:Uncharacterized protein n=1 Tax=Paramecium sonneborni TaxID=65129 RepID=A0A8S1MSI5_9CILI|nr:unnamed protein product [Paramecium sonneborni]